MMSILKKELKSLRPFLILILCMGGYIIISNLFLESQNIATIDTLIAYFHGESYFVQVLFYLVFSLALTSGLIMREYDEKTIEFLSFLPVSLSKVFIIKILLSTAIIALLPICLIVYGIVTHAISRHSLLWGFYPDVLLSIFLLHLYQILFLVILGTFLSFFRRFSWILMALIRWFYILLKNINPDIGVFNIFNIVKIEFSGAKVVIPWKMLLYQTPLMILIFLVSCFIFVDPDKRLYELYETIKRSAHKKFTIYIVTGLAVLLFGSTLMYSFYTTYNSSSPEDLGGLDDNYTKYSAEKQGVGTLKGSTVFYEFEYPANFDEPVKELFALGDPIYRELSAFFDYKHPVKIYVDMKGKSINYAGTAHWQNIYLNFSAVSHPREFAAVLAHETAHVFLESMSDRRLSNDAKHNKFFHEGMAGYLEYIFHRSSEEETIMREAAAAAYALRPLTFEELVDYDKLRKYYNHMLVYNFGTLFCESIIDIYGKEGIKSLLHILAAKEETFKLTGMEKWRSVFQYARLDSEKVFLHFQKKLESYREKYNDKVSLVKDIKAAVDAGGDQIKIIPNNKSFIEGWSVMCLVRNSPEDTDQSLRKLYLRSDNNFYLKKSSVYRSGFWYQLYLKKKDGSRVLYLPWQEIKL